MNIKNNRLFQSFVITLSFIFALIMEIVPWPINFEGLRPAWIILVLTYWILAIPNIINIGTAFVVGLVWDLSLGSILGEHALFLSLYAYLVASNYVVIRNLSLWLQSFLLVLSILVINFMIFLLELFVHSAQFDPQYLLGALISGVLYPWMFLLLRRVRQALNLNQ